MTTHNDPPAGAPTAETVTVDDKPRSIEQVRFVSGLPWEDVQAIYRQAVADGGYTMSYGSRAKEVLACAATSLDGRWTAGAIADLRFIGTLLVLWEGSLMLTEDHIADLARQLQEARFDLAGTKGDREAAEQHVTILRGQLQEAQATVEEYRAARKYITGRRGVQTMREDGTFRNLTALVLYLEQVVQRETRQRPATLAPEESTQDRLERMALETSEADAPEGPSDD